MLRSRLTCRSAKHAQRSSQIILQAEQRAAQMIEEAKNAARTEGAREKAAAQAEIEQQMASAKDQLREQVALLAVAGAEKILQKEVDAQAHVDLAETVARAVALDAHDGRESDDRASVCRSRFFVG